MKSVNSNKIMGDILKLLETSYLKFLKVFFKVIRSSIPFLKELGKGVIKSGKRLIKYLLTLRIGIRPEFKESIKNFSFKKVISKIGKVREIKFTDLKNVLFSKKAARFYGFILPLVLALIIFRRVAPLSAQILGYDERLNSYLSGNNLTSGIEKDADSVDQVYFVFEEGKNYVTDSKNAKVGVATEGEYVVWNESVEGNWQIFLFHIPTKTKSQLTYSGNNINPKVSKGRVVWQGIRSDGVWQIYLYDGSGLGPISTGDYSFNPDINGNFVVFSRKDINGGWRSSAYSINDRKIVDIDFGPDNEYVKLNGKDILIGYEGSAKKFSLNVEDLMILDLGALSPQSSTSIEAIQKEIEALTGEIQ